MPDLNFNIKFSVDDASIETVKDRLDQVYNPEQAPDPLKPVTESAEKLETKLKRLIVLNETRFRQDKIGQTQAVKNAQSIERAARNMGLLNDNTLKGVQAQRQLFLSQQRIETGFKGMASSSASANLALVNLGRIVQDLPFGFLGISNNIDPALTSFRNLVRETGSTRLALSSLLRSLMGSGGLIFALGSLLPTAMLVAQTGFNMFKKGAEDAEQAFSEFTQSLIDDSRSIRESTAFDFLSVRETQNQIESLERIEGVVKTIADTYRSIEITAFANDYREGLKEYLESLEQEFGITKDEAIEFESVLQSTREELERVQALANLDPLGKFRSELELTTDNVLRNFNTGLERSDSLLRQQAGSIQQAIIELQAGDLNTLKALGLDPEDTRTAIEVMKSELNKLSDFVPEKPLVPVLPPVEEVLDNAREIQFLLGADLAAQQADFLIDIDVPFEKEVFEQAAKERQQRLIQIEKDGVAQRLLEIEREKNAYIEGEKKKEEAATARALLIEQLESMTFSLANNFIGALTQLNQAQTDETEKQARAKFEQQKKLQIASAVVNAAQAIVRQYSDLPLTAAIPASAVVAGITGVQIAAIKKTKFESSGESGGDIAGGVSSGGITISESEPAFTEPTNIFQPQTSFQVKNEVLANRKELFVLTKIGEEEFLESQVE